MLKLFKRKRRKLMVEGERGDPSLSQNQDAIQTEKNVMRASKLKSYLTYAIGEILLVMIGILLALQVNNWNERNKYQKEEQQILKSLQAEFEDNIASLEQVLGSHQRIITNIERVLKNDDLHKEGIDHTDLIAQWRDAVFGKTYDPQFGVLHSLLSSDKINLIEHDQLRNRIAKIPGMLEDYSEDEDLAVQSIYNFYLPELFRLKPENISSEGYVIMNYLNFLIPNIHSIIEEGEVLKAGLLEDLKMIETQIK
ncbi:MAG: DUF6090 family protein [Saprospiraceae bacterium]